MAAHNQIGKKGEELAHAYCLRNSYLVIHQNWRHRHWEVDLIASKTGVLHFIEVKCLSSNKSGYPEQSVSKKKIRNLMDASVAYIELFPQWNKLQFDILAITLQKDAEADFFLIEDVYDF